MMHGGCDTDGENSKTPLGGYSYRAGPASGHLPDAGAGAPGIAGELSGAQALAGGTPRLVDSREMAAILGKPMQVVQRLARTGRIPAYRVGHSYRFDPVRVLESCWE